MFSGIVAKGSVKAKACSGENVRLSVLAPRGWSFKKGESVSVNGVCSTVVSSQKNSADFQYMPETLQKTTVGNLARGSAVNLERSIKMSDRLHGHFVQGHVDTKGEVLSIEKSSGYVVQIRVGKEYMRFIAEKGSITLDGVSLTVAKRTNDSFSVALIPFTLEHTTLGVLQKGDTVNVETDLLARQLAAYINTDK